MSTRRASLSYSYSFLTSLSSRFFRSLFRGSLRRKALSIALILSLLSLPVSLLPIAQFPLMTVAVAMVKDSQVRSLVSFLASFFAGSQLPHKDETIDDRIARVAQIQISPMKLVGYEGEGMAFSAMPTDSSDEVVHGVKFSWRSSNTESLQIDDTGRARFIQPGIAWITCRAGAIQATAPVLIKGGHRPFQTDAQWSNDQESLNLNGAIEITPRASAQNIIPAFIDKLAPTAYAQSEGPPSTDLAYDELWSDPANLVGTPNNRAVEPVRLGAVMPEGSNFNLAIPIVNLTGRGIDLNLSLYYNSRVWSKHSNAVTFDAVTSWPSPGFSLGFGRIVLYNIGPGGNPTCKFMLIEPDGTRRYLGSGSYNGDGYALGGPYQTSDGSHIVYTGNGRDGGDIHYPNGKTVTFTSVNNRLLPTTIMDRNGNFIQITYKAYCNQIGNEIICGTYPPEAIDYITDTLGRVVQFVYDSVGKLTTITSTMDTVRLDYQNVTFNGTFSGLTVEKFYPGPASCLRHVLFSSTNTGYLFTYSPFGMIYNYSARKDMSFNSWPVQPIGIQDGTQQANVTFNYPTTATPALTAPPSFSQWTESAINSPTSVFTYSTSINTIAQTKTFTITQPDASTLSLTRSTNASSPANGLLIQAEIKNSQGISFAKTENTYVNDGSGSPQVQSIVETDDASPANQTKIGFDFDQYGNVTNKREYGFQVGGSWQVQKRTHYTYSTLYTSFYTWIPGLVTLTEVFDGLQDNNDTNDVLIAKTSNAYDNYVSMGGVENYGGPPTPPPNHTGILRGNLTGSSEYVDLVANTTITHLNKYDIFGNVVKAQVNCCQEKDLTNTQATYWSQPSSVMSGDPNGVHETETLQYSFNTSLRTSATNAAGLTSSYGYDAAQRPSSVSVTHSTNPTLFTTTQSINDGSLTQSDTKTYDDGGVTVTIQAYKVFDGWGRVIQEVDATGAQVNTTYDNMGRVASKTNPFPQGGTPGALTTYQYDVLGRLTITTMPDSNLIRSDYSGSAVTETDPVGRKIKRETDGFRRLIKVTEQDSGGALTLQTTYSYNMLDKLTLVNQGGQTRAYKHDAIGRVLYERIPEQTATINDGTGTFWTSKFSYTEFNAVQTRQDARGVVTTNLYDALHRVTNISYDVTNAPGVAATPSVTIGYDAGAISFVSVGSGYIENYAFDPYHRISTVTRTIDNRSYTTKYEYNGAGQRNKLTYPSNSFITQAYDGFGRLSSITNQVGAYYVSGMTYTITSLVTGLTLGNGVTESYGYDALRMQLTSQSAIKSGNTLMSLTYNYQAQAGQSGAGTTAGNTHQLISLTGTVNSVSENNSYTYDLGKSVATATQNSNGVSGQRTYRYDRWGNRTTTYDDNKGINQIQSITLQQSGGAPTNRISSVTNYGVTSNYTYDAAGNVTNDGAHAYTYDAANRIVSVDGGATSYSYDNQNRRYKKVSAGATTHFIWEGLGVIAEHNGSTGAVLTEYIYRRSKMIAKVVGGTKQYFLGDILSARLTLDASGNVLGRQAHLPFGEDFAESDTQQKYHFTSYERDSAINSDYAVNRQYSHVVGRFQQADPFQASAGAEDPQSWNRYSYVENDPIHNVDPSGLLLASPEIGDPCSAIPTPIPIPDPIPISCTVRVYDRLIEAVHGIPIPGARHGYIVYTVNGFPVPLFFEGQKSGRFLRAVGTFLPLAADRPERDRLDGQKSGVDVCLWSAILYRDVSLVNAQNIRYRWYGPNSSSALRYMLESLPARGWYHMPFMIGYGSKLPGLEK